MYLRKLWPAARRSLASALVAAVLLPLLVFGDVQHAAAQATGVISGEMWIDQDRDGVRESTEPRIPGGTVRVWSIDAQGDPFEVVVSIVIGADGRYEATVPAGRYVLQFATPAGLEPTRRGGVAEQFDSDIGPEGLTDPVTVIAGQTQANIDAGFLEEAALIAGEVWQDLDGDGVREPDEPPLSNAVVYAWTVDANGNPDSIVDRENPNFDGSYELYLMSGTYILQFSSTGGFEPSPAGEDQSGSVSDIDANGFTQPLNVAVGEELRGIDAGFIDTQEGTLTGIVWQDLDRDGARDPGEPGIGGVSLNVWRVDAAGEPMFVVASGLTGPDGRYGTFVRPDDYLVQFIRPAGFSVTQVDAAADDIDSDVSASGLTAPFTVFESQTRENVDAGYVVDQSQITGAIWRDLDEDGIRDSTEPRIAGGTVNVWTTNGQGEPFELVESLVSDTTGRYEARVDAGEYILQFVTPEGLEPTRQAAVSSTINSDIGANGLTAPLTLDLGQTLGNVDAGYVEARVTAGPLSGVMWHDLDVDGVRDPGEPGIGSGVVNVWTTLPNGFLETLVQSVITGPEGEYQVDGLEARDHVVVFRTPDGFRITETNIGDPNTDSDVRIDGSTAAFAMTEGQPRTNIDAGYVTFPGTLNGRVWHDRDGDGRQDSGEPPLAGVPIRIWLLNDAGDALEVVLTTEVDESGRYSAELPAGSYAMQFTRPAGYIPSSTNIVGDPTIDSDVSTGGLTAPIELADGQALFHIDAGYISLPSTITGAVFDDLDGSQGRNDREPGVSDVLVTLTFEEGSVQSQRTSSSGRYTFDRLLPGSYVVTVTAPSGRAFVAKDVVIDVFDSDVDPATGETDPIDLPPGWTVFNVDAGLVIAAELGDANCDGEFNILDAFATSQYVVELREGVEDCSLVTDGQRQISLAAVTVGDEPVTIQTAFRVSQCVVGFRNVLCPEALP